MKQTRKRILLADCHEDALITLEKLLEDAGFETTSVWTAEEALKLVDSTAFDLAFVNEYLPDAECEEVLKAIQESGQQTLCVVMQPREPEFMDFVRFGASGAKDIVCKRSSWQILQLAKECLVCDRKQISVA